MRVGTIAGHELIPGKVIRNYLTIIETDLSIPYIILCGTEPGPNVLISAGIHNSEYVGIQAAIELSNELDVFSMRGNVIILPLVNRSGFENRTMSMVYEDGKNLNRVFPGNAADSMADHIAFSVFETFIKSTDAYIDLHSGDGYEELVPYVYYVGDTPAEETAKKMIGCVNVRYCVRSRCLTGGAYNVASVQGIPSVLIERGQLGLYSREEIDADQADVLNILRCLGVLDGQSYRYPKLELMEYDDVAPYSGCWYPKKKAGETFQKGDKLGEIRDYFGNSLFIEYAPAAGVILYQCSSLNIVQKGPMVSYGVPIACMR